MGDLNRIRFQKGRMLIGRNLCVQKLPDFRFIQCFSFIIPSRMCSVVELLIHDKAVHHGKFAIGHVRQLFVVGYNHKGLAKGFP